MVSRNHHQVTLDTSGTVVFFFSFSLLGVYKDTVGPPNKQKKSIETLPLLYRKRRLVSYDYIYLQIK